MEQGLPRYEMLPAEMNVNEMPLSTTVVVKEEGVQVGEERLPTRDHLVWSLCNTLYGNVLCLGLLAFFFSVKSRDCKVLGDYNGAQTYGSTAKCLNITALVVNITITVISIIVISVVLSSAAAHYRYPYPT